MAFVCTTVLWLFIMMQFKQRLLSFKGYFLRQVLCASPPICSVPLGVRGTRLSWWCRQFWIFFHFCASFFCPCIVSIFLQNFSKITNSYFFLSLLIFSIYLGVSWLTSKRPFKVACLVAWSLNESKAGVGPVLMETSLLLLYQWCCSHAKCG